MLAAGGCGRAFFYPQRALRLEPSTIGLEFEDVRFHADDGVGLHGWYLPPRGAARPRAIVAFFHGNAENISTHLGAVAWLPSAGYGVFLFDYRGYGRSEKTPDIEGAHRDGMAALREAASRADHEQVPLVVYGQSLGGAIALETVAQAQGTVPVRALVVDSAFSDYRLIAREKLGSFWLTWPLSWALAATVPDERRPVEAAARLHAIPLLLVHGASDDVVPVHHGILLFEASSAATELWLLPGIRHGQAFQSQAMRKGLVDFLNGIVEDPETRQPAALQRSIEDRRGLWHSIAKERAGKS
jgi:alpha-beta hydrolase superfamily lysophospholipase